MDRKPPKYIPVPRIIIINFTGLNSHIIYPNGISCTFPEHIQEEMIRTITGLEKAKILFPGKYDELYIRVYIYKFLQAMVLNMIVLTHVS